MGRIVLLDTGPLGLAAMPPGRSHVDAFLGWLSDLDAEGVVIMVPAVADYEVRRELTRKGLDAGIARLDATRANLVYLAVTKEAWDCAAWLWALLRNDGIPTAPPEDIDGDAILAGQALTDGSPGDEVIVATTNVGHLLRFPGVDARAWTAIKV